MSAQHAVFIDLNDQHPTQLTNASRANVNPVHRKHCHKKVITDGRRYAAHASGPRSTADGARDAERCCPDPGVTALTMKMVITY